MFTKGEHFFSFAHDMLFKPQIILHVKRARTPDFVMEPK
jgi:hypothetical protein